MTNITHISTAPSFKLNPESFLRSTLTPPLSLARVASITPLHTLDANGVCIFCNEQPKVFFNRTWKDYCDKHNGQPPLTKGEWFYYRSSCLDFTGWTAPHPAEATPLQQFPRTFLI